MSDENPIANQDLLDFGAADEAAQSASNEHVLTPSAPPASSDSDDFLVVNGDKASSNGSDIQEEMNKVIHELAASVQETLKNDKVVAEADSSSSSRSQAPPASEPQPEAAKSSKKSAKEAKDAKETKECSICPYYNLGCDYLSKVEIPPYVRDLLLWKDPKFTGIVFGTELVLLISLASFSLLTVIGSLMLLSLTSLGAYRFYLAFMFRIKGTPDETFDKLSAYEISLPKEKIKQLTHLLEDDINKVLNKVKSIVLWDNIYVSTVAFAAFYFIYCVGSVFNTLTLLILALVSAFTLPKVYEIYKVPIDGLLEKTTSTIHMGVKQVMTKLPFLNKKKIQ